LKTIVITSQKGGSGKTTLAAHLAVEAERVGDGPAWVIDTDQQANLSLWHERREDDTPQRAEMPFSRVAEGLEALTARGAAYSFIDTPPTISEQTAAVLELADLVLIPVRAGPLCSSLHKPSRTPTSLPRPSQLFRSTAKSRVPFWLTAYPTPSQ
jgi:chromosome partitioning protein